MTFWVPSYHIQTGMLVHDCNPSAQEARWRQEDQKLMGGMYSIKLCLEKGEKKERAVAKIAPKLKQ